MRIKSDITDNPYSVASWILITCVVAPLEIYLLWKHDHTLSEQMRWWIRNSKWGSVLMMFWIWVAVHFIIEPIVRYIAALMRGDK